MDVDASWTLKQVQAHLRANFDAGTYCPACGQRVQRYKFKFNSGMARLMIEFRKADDWIHVTNHFKALGINCNSFNYGKLKFWGLIERASKDPEEDKNSSGLWCITQAGRDFVDKKFTIKSHVYFYNNKVLGYSEEDITIEDALGERFSWTELMGGS